MPPFLCEDNSVRGIGIELRNHVARVSKRRTVELLPLAIKLLEIARDLVCLMLILGHQEPDSHERASNSSGCIQSRSENESHTPGSDRFSLEARRANHRAQSDIFGFLQHPQPVTDEHAVLATKLRDIGNCGERNEIEHAPDERVILSEFRGEGKRELERDSNCREMLVRVSAV